MITTWISGLRALGPEAGDRNQPRVREVFPGPQCASSIRPGVAGQRVDADADTGDGMIWSVPPDDDDPAPPSPAPIPLLTTELPETLGYQIKRRLLGAPLTTAQLREERLANPVALGVLAPDMISSSAYGTEEMLLILLPWFGAAAFTLLLPMTLAVIFVLVVTMLSYREVVMIYTRAGGSYVVARENFGPGVAQVAAVALLIDYTVTVAVQTAAGTAAVVSYPALSRLAPSETWITVGVVALLAYGNLRGIREAGRAFAFPTFFFSVSLGLVVVIGLVELATGHLHPHPIPLHGPIGVINKSHGILTGLGIFYLLRSFANGGSSLTGLEAVSNGVSAFRPPEGRNARRTLVVMCAILGSLVTGVSVLTHYTHAVPYRSGTPTVISQVAHDVLGTSLAGKTLFFLVQLSTMLILYTGANTSFNGFPFLASFVAEDAFLPRQLTHRGHRLAFSNGIVVLAVVSVALLIATRAKVDSLIAFYAIGVFTGFAMAGAGLSRYHLRTREAGWRRKLSINLTSAALSGFIVLIFAVTKFTQCAWLVVVIFPIMVYVLIRLNRQYRDEAEAYRTFAPRLDVEPNFRRHVVLVFVDSLDLATLRAVRYARGLRPSEIRAVHIVLDSARAETLADRWGRLEHGGINLELHDCPDRRIRRTALELVVGEVDDGVTEATVLLPRRSYSPLIGRLLHDRTADRIAATVSRVPHAAATIVPFDPRLPPVHTASHKRLTMEQEFAAAEDSGRRRAARVESGEAARTPARPDGVVAINQLRYRERARIEGRIRSVEVRPKDEAPVLEAVVADDTGGVSLVFLGRREIRGVAPGRRVRVEGMVATYEGRLAMRNPRLILLPDA